MFNRQLRKNITSEDVYADLGVRTIHSATGFSTLNENINIAVQRGLEYLAVTDYFVVDMDNGASIREEIAHLVSLKRLKEPRISLIPGMEISFSTNLKELPLEMPEIPWMVASDFTASTRHRTLEMLQSNITLKVRQGIKAIAHPEQSLSYLLGDDFNCEGITDQVKEFFDWLIVFSKQERVYLGVSELSTRSPYLCETQSYWLKFASQNGNPLYLHTDAVTSIDVGDFEKVIDLLNVCGVQTNNILNCDREKLKKLFD